MTDGQFYTFVGIGAGVIVMLYDVARLQVRAIKELKATHFSICSLHTAFEHANTDMQSRVYEAAAAAGRSSGLLEELVQPIRDGRQRREKANTGSSTTDPAQPLRRPA